MNRIIIVILNILIGINLIGCNNVNNETIKEPVINKLSIKGTWKIEEVFIDINQEDIKVNKEIKIEIKSFEFFDEIFNNPIYRLKVVDSNYIASYEKNIKVSELIQDKSNIEVYSVMSNNKPVFELILDNEKEGYVISNEGVFKVIKESDETNIDVKKAEDEKNSYEAYYNSDVGIMLGLKTNSQEENQEEKYRTLWISYSNGILNPILEKENIILPRINGIWKLEKEVNNKEGSNIETFKIGPIDEKDSVKGSVEIFEKGHKTINFVANDYIAVEKQLEDNKIEKQILSIGNINSKKGIELIDIYPKEYISILDNEYIDNYKNLPKSIKENVEENVDYSNFTIKRNSGKWMLVGSLKNSTNQENIDYYSSIYPNKKILNFDTLYIKWKTLKGELPFIKDAYTSPTGRILIAIFENRLTIYELDNGMIKGNPLANVELNNGEEVIMAEWATDNYVDTWEKSFSDGIIINEKED